MCISTKQHEAHLSGAGESDGSLGGACSTRCCHLASRAILRTATLVGFFLAWPAGIQGDELEPDAFNEVLQIGHLQSVVKGQLLISLAFQACFGVVEN